MKKYLNIIFSTILLLIAASCTDDHFDVDPAVSSERTVWENIRNRQDLSQFADLLQRVYVTKSEGTVETAQTYADLFNHDQVFTVWAPKNDSFNYEYYNKLLGYNNVDSTYKVEKELIQNQMSRFRFVLNGEAVDTVELFNSKVAEFNKKAKTFGSQKIDEYNLGCNNGLIHITAGRVDYTYNMYEFLGTLPQIDSVYQFFKSFEKVEFDEYNSTKGPTINGQVTWVDSVTYVSNQIFYSVGAYLNNEDSLYAMIIPTNTAWEDALKRTKSYYNFRTKYTQEIHTQTEAGVDTTYTEETTYTTEEVDSLNNLYSKSAITNNLVFNARYQYRPWDIENPINCDSLRSTHGTIFRQPYLTNLFGNYSLYNVSNGYVYVTDNFGYRACDTWASDINIPAYLSFNIDQKKNCNLTSSTQQFYRNDSTINFTVAQFTEDGANYPEVTFKLNNVLSCKYDIFLVMAYNTSAMKSTKFTATLTYYKNAKDSKQKDQKLTPLADDTLHNFQMKNKDFVNVSYLDTVTISNVEYIVPVHNDTIQLARDFEFPVCYYGLQNAFPLLNIKTDINSTEKKDYTREMWIQEIILVAKEN